MCGIIKTLDFRRGGFIRHRGTEFKEIQYGRYRLIHHRLPIQTKSGDNFSQPVVLDNGLILMFVGELFGLPDEFSSDVDYLTTMIGAIRSEGELFRVIFQNEMNTWDGFWAIVIEDTNTGFTYAFTDPLGKKQLYYNSRGEICSEITPLILDPKGYDPYYRAHVEKFGYCFCGNTPWADVTQIQPGHVYQFKGSLMTAKFPYYFNWDKETKGTLKELMERSVSQRVLTTGDNPVAMLVSGGLDSSIIAALTLDLGKEVKYYSIENDESEYVYLLEKQLGINVEYVKMAEYDDLDQTLLFNEQPVDLGSLLPQHNIFGRIDKKYKVVLTGDGADELFGGYKRNEVYDAQVSDIVDELTYYHLPRLDRASMRRTMELRTPFLSHDVVRHAIALPREWRKNKMALKEAFGNRLPQDIVRRAKHPLKTQSLVEDKEKHKRRIIDRFYELNFFS